MQWGLARTGGWTVHMAVPETVHMLSMLLESALLQQVEQAAAAHGASMAAWVREAMRRVTRDDFPESWRVGETQGRSHDSGHDGRRFMLRLDDESSNTLGTLTQAFGRSAAEVVRQLIAQATPEDFPQSWHLAVGEQCQRAIQPGEGD
jgi:hypothetical protein